MSRLEIECVSCGRLWAVAGSYSLYERQRVESCPCPGCGAYTLCCAAPEPADGLESEPVLRRAAA